MPVLPCQFSTTQKNVPLSSTKAEYVAVYLEFSRSEVDVGCITVKEENAGAVHLANNPATNPNSKHINVHHHFLHEKVASGKFKVVYVQ